MSSILDELEEWEQYLKVKSIDIHMLDNFGESANIPAEQANSEHTLSAKQKEKPSRKRRLHRVLSR